MCKGDIKGTIGEEERAYISLVKNGEDVHDPRLTLGALRKSLPAEVWVKSLRRSMQWMLWDLAVVFTGLYLTKTYVYPMEMSLLKLGLLLVHYMITGFFMWGIFVIGHDCGHGSFSNYPVINHIMGLFNHSSILVPFSAWARSHRFHHMYHNHETEDWSFPWCHDPSFDTPTQQKINKMPLVRALGLPTLGYFFYLTLPNNPIGVDGCHYLPGVFRDCRIWRDANKKELALGWLDTACVLAFLYFHTQVLCEGSLAMYFTVYVPAWFNFIFWLYTVTYLQHHSEGTKVFDDTTWKYATAAFETVDRVYGGPIDMLHHHISDCHVIHHLFFTSIPHYNLRKATDALVKYLNDEGMGDIYQQVKTHDFAYRVFKYTYDFGGRAHLVTADSGKYEKCRTGQYTRPSSKKDD